MRPVVLVAVAALVGGPPQVGCSGEAREVVAGALTPPVEKPVLTAATRAQLDDFTRVLVEAAHRGDKVAINALVDWDTLARRGCAGVRVQPEMVAGVAKSAGATAAERGLPAQLAAVSTGAAQLRYLGPQELGGETWQTFRFMQGEGAFDHLSLLVALDAAGKPRIVDFQQLSGGEPMSSVMRRLALPLIASDAASVLERMGGKERMMLQNMQTVVEIQKAHADGRLKEAAAMFKQLPPELRREKWLMLEQVTLASRLGEAQHLAAIQELRRLHPDDPSTGVHMIDGYRMLRRHDEALAAIDAVQKRAVADAYFDVLRALVLLEAGRLDEARAAAERALASEPELLDAHWLVVSVLLKKRDHAAVSRHLLDMRRTFELTFELESVPDYADYVKSREYARVKAQLTR